MCACVKPIFVLYLYTLHLGTIFIFGRTKTPFSPPSHQGKVGAVQFNGLSHRGKIEQWISMVNLYDAAGGGVTPPWRRSSFALSDWAQNLAVTQKMRICLPRLNNCHQYNKQNAFRFLITLTHEGTKDRRSMMPKSSEDVIEKLVASVRDSSSYRLRTAHRGQKNAYSVSSHDATGGKKSDDWLLKKGPFSILDLDCFRSSSVSHRRMVDVVRLLLLLPLWPSRGNYAFSFRKPLI